MAAGLGFKTFTTGEVLTAADTNGYLMQGVLVFASAAARDAAITSPQEGQCCYLKDTDAVLTYSGSAWVGFDDSNAIQNSIVDAKGDIVAASAADTPARLAVGSNGETLVADSSTSTGLRYQTGYNGNAIINGGFDIWQRGTSITLGATQAYTADRWYSYRGGLVTGCIVSRQASSLTGIQYAARVQRNTGDTSTQVLTFQYNAESADSYRFAGQTVTMSFYVRAGANYSAASSALNYTLQYGTGTDQTLANGLTGQTSAVSTVATLTTSWQRVTATAAIPSTATQVAMSFTYTPVGTAGAADYFEVTGVQLEVGSVATNFKRSNGAGGTIQGELAACQRYYYRQGGDSAYQAMSAYSNAVSTTNIDPIIVPLPVTMRVEPTVLDTNAIMATDGVNVFTGTFTLATQDSKSIGQIKFVGSGLTQYRAYQISANNSTSAYVGLSAEL